MKKLVSTLLLGSLTAFLGLAACSGEDDAPAAPADAGTKRPDAIPYVPPDTSSPDPDTGPPATVLTGGESFSIVYSAAGGVIGVDGRPNVAAYFDATGGLKSYYWSDDENLSRGVASIAGAGSDTIAGWGAWREGPTTGHWYTAKPDGFFTFGPGNDFHYAVGRKSISAAWPTTMKTYALAGGSAPTVDGIAEPGTLTSATATCDLGVGRTCSFTLSAGGSGGTIALSINNTKINTAGEGVARVQTNDPKGSVIAMFAGDAAEEIILVYGGTLEGGTNAGKNLRGAAVLKAP